MRTSAWMKSAVWAMAASVALASCVVTTDDDDDDDNDTTEETGGKTSTGGTSTGGRATGGTQTTTGGTSANTGGAAGEPAGEGGAAGSGEEPVVMDTIEALCGGPTEDDPCAACMQDLCQDECGACMDGYCGTPANTYIACMLEKYSIEADFEQLRDECNVAATPGGLMDDREDLDITECFTPADDIGYDGCLLTCKPQ